MLSRCCQNFCQTIAASKPNSLEGFVDIFCRCFLQGQIWWCLLMFSFLFGFVKWCAQHALRNAFYYSYFQELVDVEHIGVGLYRIIWDHRTEYPDVLNAIRRFNIYQDTALGTLYVLSDYCPVVWRVDTLLQMLCKEILLAFEYRILRGFGLALPHPFHFFRFHVILVNGLGQALVAAGKGRRAKG